MKTPQVGDRVRVPWGLDLLDGLVIDVDAGGARERAVVQVDLPGASADDGPATVTLPMDALRPADWWPNQGDPVGGWAATASYERHVLAAIDSQLSRRPEVIFTKPGERGDGGFDLLATTPNGKLVVIVKYFFRPRIQTGQMRQLAHSLRRSVEHVHDARYALIVTNVSVGSRLIDQQIRDTVNSSIPVRLVRWRSSDDDATLEHAIEGLLGESNDYGGIANSH